MSKQYFNPFDKKSSWQNLKESLHSFVDPPLEINQPGVQDISELVDTNQIKLNLSHGSEDKSLINKSDGNLDTENQLKQSTSRKLNV